MTRPLLTREAREKCARRNHGRIFAPLGRHPWCEACGALFLEEVEYEDASSDGETATVTERSAVDDIDWPATEAADHEQMEREGQGRLPL